MDIEKYRAKYIKARNDALVEVYEALRVFAKRHCRCRDYEDVLHTALVRFMTEGWDPAAESFEHAIIKYLRKTDKMFEIREYRYKLRRRSSGEMERYAAPDEYGAIEARLDLERLLPNLTPRQREVILGRFLDGCSRSELAYRGSKHGEPVSRCAKRGIERLRKAANIGEVV